MLIVAATAAEIAPLLAALQPRSQSEGRLHSCTRANHEIDVLTTGVGMVATAAWSSRVLAMREYDVALNLGVCGSFDREIPAGNVVHVISEELPEMGAETGDAFLTLLDLKLLERDEFPFQDGRLINRKPPSMAALQQRCEPQVETMEGAAFMYCCLIRRTPFAEIRAVSNVVETRNRAAWKLGEAIDSLNSTALRIIDEP